MDALAEYFTRANLMYAHVEDLLDRCDHDFEVLVDEGVWIYFKSYFTLWLAALFVTVEGYRRLKINDARVSDLTDKRMRFLKDFRDEAFHFSPKQELSLKLIPNVGWAHDLHEAIGAVLSDYYTQTSTLLSPEIAPLSVVKAAPKKRKTAKAIKRAKSK